MGLAPVTAVLRLQGLTWCTCSRHQSDAAAAHYDRLLAFWQCVDACDSGQLASTAAGALLHHDIPVKACKLRGFHHDKQRCNWP